MISSLEEYLSFHGVDDIKEFHVSENRKDSPWSTMISIVFAMSMTVHLEKQVLGFNQVSSSEKRMRSNPYVDKPYK